MPYRFRPWRTNNPNVRPLRGRHVFQIADLQIFDLSEITCNIRDHSCLTQHPKGAHLSQCHWSAPRSQTPALLPHLLDRPGRPGICSRLSPNQRHPLRCHQRAPTLSRLPKSQSVCQCVSRRPGRPGAGIWRIVGIGAAGRCHVGSFAAGAVAVRQGCAP
jgi:hypothetical protein